MGLKKKWGGSVKPPPSETAANRLKAERDPKQGVLIVLTNWTLKMLKEQRIGHLRIL